MINNNRIMYFALSFAAVARAESFSNAARKSGISKAQLSRHVSELEKLLGTTLLQRTTRSVALTEQGQKFLVACEGLEEGYNEAINHIKNDFENATGTLKITVPIDFGIQFLPSIIHEFSQRYPGINVVLSLSNINENLIDQNFDVAIRIANKLPDSSLKMLPLLEFKRIICVSPQYLTQNGTPQKLAELKNHRCITSVNRNNTIHPQWHFKQNKKMINVKLENVIEVDSLFGQVKLIKLGTGIGRLPNYFIKDELKNKMLVEIFSEIEKPITFVYLLYPKNSILPQKTRLFIDFVKKHRDKLLAY